MGKQLDDILDGLVAKKKAKQAAIAEKSGVDASQPSPLEGARVTGDVEKDDAAEAAVILTALDKRNQAFDDQSNVDYYLPIVFAFGEQGREFLKATGWDKYVVNDERGCYFDGIAIAKALGIPLPERKVHFYEATQDDRLITEVGIINT